MKDEIKLSKSEIIGICEFLKIHHFENSYLLIDYITKLQEENEELKKNQRLTPEQRQHLHLELDEILEIYKQRIDKAIKYIDEHCIDDEFICNLSSKEKGILEVRKILRGDE